MDDDDVVWPWGMSDRDPDPATRPWIFSPKGFMVAVLEDAGAAEAAKVALTGMGIREKDLRIFTGPQLLEDRERFLAQQGVLRRAVEKVTIDSKAVDLFLDYAHDGRSFLWVHVPEREDANRAIRGLSDHEVLHIRYWGEGDLEDIHVR